MRHYEENGPVHSFLYLKKKKKSMRGKKPLSHQEGVMSHKYRFSLHSVTSLGCRVIQYLHARRS